MSTVLLADDHAFIRAGVEAVLAGTAHHLVATVATGREALAAIAQHDPDICVFDVAMPDGNGIETLQSMRREGDNRPVVLLSAMISDSGLADAVAAGVNGIVSKEGAEETLVEVLDLVASGKIAIPAELLARAVALRLTSPSPLDLLTPREKTIVELIARGVRNREIAEALGITEGTVKVYLHALYIKLGVQNRTELAVMALRA